MRFRLRRIGSLADAEALREQGQHGILEPLGQGVAALRRPLQPVLPEALIAAQGFIPGGCAEDLAAVAAKLPAEVNRPEIGDEAAKMPEAAQELGLGEADMKTGLDGWRAVACDDQRALRPQPAAEEEVAQGAVRFCLLLGGEDGPQDLLGASGVTVGGDEESVGVVPPAVGQWSPEMTVEAIHLHLLGGTW
jgi:hypothetical protein